MPIPLDDRGPNTPTLKLAEIGDFAVVRLCHRTTKAMTDPVTKKPKLKDDGNPRNELVVTGIYMQGKAVTTVGNGQDEHNEPIEPGDLVRVFIAGHRWGSLIEAENHHGKLNVGDVMRITFKGTEKSSIKGGADKKVWEFKLRPGNLDTEASEIAKAEDLYRQMKANGGRPAPASSGPMPSDDDIPF